MSDEAQRTSGLFIPYPLLGILMTLLLALGSGIVGLFIQVNSLQTTLLLRDASYQQDQKKAWDKIEQLQVYIQNDRERLGKLEERLERRTRN